MFSNGTSGVIEQLVADGVVSGTCTYRPSGRGIEEKRRSGHWGEVGGIMLTIVITSTALEAAISGQKYDEQRGAAIVSSSIHDDECAEKNATAHSPKLCLSFGWPHGRTAQQSSFQVEAMSGISGRPIPIKVTLPEDMLRSDGGDRGPAFLRFRGIPAEVTLSSGFRIRDSWMVSLRDVSTLSMNAPAGYSGSYTLTASLHKGKPFSAETRMVMVHLGRELPREHSQQTARAVPSEDPPAATVNPTRNAVTGAPAKTLSKAEEATFMEYAMATLRNGDFDAARLICVELAVRGSGRAAFLLAQTYDPDELQTHFVVGMQPDVDKALRWYSRAAELGNRDAINHLRTMPQRQ